MFTNDVVRVGNQWHFEDGTILPVVSGGSDLTPQPDPSDGTGGTLPTGAEGSPEPEPTYGSQFLTNIPEEDRPVVQKYIQDWDKGVNERFQKIHSEYEPYKKLGDVDTLNKAIQVMTLLDEQPEQVFKLLQAEFGQLPQQEQQPTKTEIPAEYEGLPPAVAEQLMNQQKMLENLAQVVISSREQTQQQQEDAALEAELTRLKKQHGEFDDVYVMTQMYHGKTGDEAVKAYQELVQNVINQQSRPKPQPPTLGGGGPLPANGKNVTDLSNKETKSLVAQMLAAQQQG